MAPTSKALSTSSVVEPVAPPKGTLKGSHRGRTARSDDQKAVLKKTREFLDSPTNPDRLNALVSALITYEIKSRLSGA